MKQISKNDQEWEKLFQTLGILSAIGKRGIFRITASQINKFRQARLMTKFDHTVNLPTLFKKHHLAILPDTRGTYLIGRFDAYQEIAPAPIASPTEVVFPDNIQTIDYGNIYSETSALLCAFNTKMIEDVVGEEVAFTVAGRMSTSQFEFRIKDNCDNTVHSIQVDNAQCEIDGGFEGTTKFAIIEAKNYYPSDFLIRQLYYPYRLWSEKITKEIMPIFMVYSNDVFTFFLYRFRDLLDYNSIEIVGVKTYQVSPEHIELDEIYEVFQKTQISPEPAKVPFPQADNFFRVVDLLGLLYPDGQSQETITSKYEFDVRQTQYYTSAGMYLGLIEKKSLPEEGILYVLSEEGKAIMMMKGKTKYLALVERILRHEVFHTAAQKYFQELGRPSHKDIVKIIRHATPNLDSGTTVPRRAQTVSSWINWIFSLPRNELDSQ